MATTITGGCLCGGVRFEATLPFSDANYCHCSRCRKHSGSEFGVQARVPREQFRLLSGEELITVYRPDGGRVKAFCSVCGSSLFGREWPEGDEIAIRLGALDGRSRDQARPPCLCRLRTAMGAGTGRRSSALRGGFHSAVGTDVKCSACHDDSN